MSWLYTIVFAGLALSSSSDEGMSLPMPFEVGPEMIQAVNLDDEKFEQTYPLNANGRVKIRNVNGSVTVEAWDRNEVRLQYTKTADSKERLADVEVRIESRPEYFAVETNYDNWKNHSGERWRNGGSLSVEFHLMVPKGATLNEIETVNGSVVVSNFVNVTRVSAVNGSVTAKNLRGTARLSTVNGEVTADFDRLESGSRINLDTVNGRANLLIPSDSNATLRADSLNGNITNDFGLPVRKGKYVGRDLYGRLGNGEVQIKLNSVNGSLAIGRRNDGRGLSPATNLLPQKDKDEEDWDGNEHSKMKPAKLDKEVAKAVKESVKASAQAMADAAGAIGPEIAKIASESATTAVNAAIVSADAMKRREIRQIQREALGVQRGRGLSDAFYLPSIPRVDSKSQSFPMKGVPKITVEAKGCSVTVRGWDKSEVHYRVTQFTDPRNEQAINITENHTGFALDLKVENPSYEAREGNFSNEARQVRIEVFVPRKSNLRIDTNAEIRIEGVSGDVQLTGSDESINIRDVDGSLRVSNSDGRIRVIGFKGEIDAETSNGTISLEGDFKKLTAKADEGSVVVTLPENASADLEASSSNVVGDGISVTRVSSNDLRTRYKIGKGGVPFQIQTEGEIRFRAAGIIREIY